MWHLALRPTPTSTWRWLERGPQQVRIRAVRDWGKVNIVTVYSLRANSDQVEIRTTMTNGGDETLTDLLSGLTLCREAASCSPFRGLPESARASPMARSPIVWSPTTPAGR